MFSPQHEGKHVPVLLRLFRFLWVLSPSTQRKDRTLKVPLYLQQGIAHVWLVDPTAQTVEVYRLHEAGYLLVGSYGGEQLARIEPFDAIEFDVGALWRR